MRERFFLLHSDGRQHLDVVHLSVAVWRSMSRILNRRTAGTPCLEEVLCAEANLALHTADGLRKHACKDWIRRRNLSEILESLVKALHGRMTSISNFKGFGAVAPSREPPETTDFP